MLVQRPFSLLLEHLDPRELGLVQYRPWLGRPRLLAIPVPGAVRDLSSVPSNFRHSDQDGTTTLPSVGDSALLFGEGHTHSVQLALLALDPRPDPGTPIPHGSASYS